MTEPAPDPRVEAVRDLLGTLVKAQRDYRTYPRNNPTLVHRRDELVAKFAVILKTTQGLTLEIRPEAIAFEGQEVYQNSNRRESVAFHLYLHGIREVRFLPGLPAEEVEAFVEALIAPLEENDLDDDLITLLWERDLRYVRYSAIDDVPSDADWVADPLGALAPALGKPASAVTFAAIHRDEGARPAQDPAADVAALAISPDEAKKLAALIEEDRKRDLALDVVDVLLQVLRGSLGPEDTRELLRILERVIELSLTELNFRRAAVILRQLVDLASSTPALTPSIQPVVVHFSKAREIGRVVQLVKDGTGFEDRDLREFLVQLTAPAAAPLAESFMVVTDRKTRKIICEAVAELVKNQVGVLAGFARDSRWYVARNIAYIIGLTHNPEGMKVLQLLATHAHEKVRAEALRAAGLVAPKLAGELVLAGLRDAERAVRFVALELAPAVGDAAFAGVLSSMLRDKGFAKADALEKKVMAVAYGRLAGEKGIGLLAELLGRRPSLFQRKVEDDRAAGAAGLAAVGTPAALDTLRAAARSDPELMPFVERALREVHVAEAGAKR